MKWFYISIIIIVICICTFIIINNKNSNGIYSKELNRIINKKIKYDKLLNINYNKSGDMVGSIESIIVDIDNKELTYKHRSYYDENIKVEIYNVSDDNIKNINELIIEYNLPAWSKLKLSDLVVYDGATEDISLNYDNTKINGNSMEIYNISFSYKLPNDAYPILRNFKNNLYLLINNDNLVNEYYEDKKGIYY